MALCGMEDDMIVIEDGNSSLAKVDSGHISKQARRLSIGELEFALLTRFPREDAEEWDRMGIIVGDPAAPVAGVALALDPTREAIETAHAAGANVLLTHHPVFLDPPAVISPSYELASTPGVAVYTAISKGVALMNFHTALDASVAATRLFPEMLNFDFERLVEPLAGNDAKGYGALCTVRASDGTFKLEHLAARCTSVFGRVPRVWGDRDTVVKRVVVANGSAGNVIGSCLKHHVDCLICGEIRYHAALEASQAGLCIVELGHDASELPLVALLAQAVREAGVPQDGITIIDQSANWASPDPSRL